MRYKRCSLQSTTCGSLWWNIAVHITHTCFYGQHSTCYIDFAIDLQLFIAAEAGSEGRNDGMIVCGGCVCEENFDPECFILAEKAGKFLISHQEAYYHVIITAWVWHSDCGNALVCGLQPTAKVVRIENCYLASHSGLSEKSCLLLFNTLPLLQTKA